MPYSIHTKVFPYLPLSDIQLVVKRKWEIISSKNFLLSFQCTVALSYCSLRMADAMISQNMGLSFWDIMHIKTKLRGLSPRANYTDRATAACRRS
jgi:hypothetical protein